MHWLSNNIRYSLAIACILIQINWCQGQRRAFEFISESSVLSFSVTHLGVLTIEGVFSEFSGQCEVNGDQVIGVKGIIKVSSISTGDLLRDESLRESYLNESVYPQITFQSTEIEATGTQTSLTGKLSIKDQEREISMPVHFRLSENSTKCFIGITTAISRKDFKLDFGAMDSLIGDEISIILSIAAE